MSRIVLFLLPVIAVMQIGCQQSTEQSGKDIFVKIDVESAFQNDPVRLQLDGKPLLESTVTTNYTVNLAWSSGLQQLSRSEHSLLFSVVDRHLQKGFDIDLTNDTSTVFIRFDKPANRISIEQSKGILLRD